MMVSTCHPSYTGGVSGRMAVQVSQAKKKKKNKTVSEK
jgi:hypothetical protein